MLSYRPRKLYVITTQELIPCKVGVATDATKRLIGLQVANWVELGLYATFPCFNAMGLERAILDHFRAHLIRGEWINLSAEIVVKRIREVLKARSYGAQTLNELEVEQANRRRTQARAAKKRRPRVLVARKRRDGQSYNPPRREWTSWMTAASREQWG